ncbi:unnamed protein product [Effrenium voratum]|nr:unnamed protein product [Effrenium voratum]
MPLPVTDLFNWMAPSSAPLCNPVQHIEGILRFSKYLRNDKNKSAKPACSSACRSISPFAALSLSRNRVTVSCLLVHVVLSLYSQVSRRARSDMGSNFNWGPYRPLLTGFYSRFTATLEPKGS